MLRDCTLELPYLQEVELDWGLAAKHGHQNLNLAALLINFTHLPFKFLKRTVDDGNRVVLHKVDAVLWCFGVNIGDFVNKFNEATRERAGEIVPVEMTVYEDRTFSLVYKVSPMAQLILKEIGQEKGSGKTPMKKVGSLTREQVRRIAEKKMPDLNAGSIEAAERIVEGTARSMGVDVK